MNEVAQPPPFHIDKIFFDGCAFGMSYYIGMYKTMYANKECYTNTQFYGCSSGVFISMGIILGIDPELFIESFHDVCNRELTMDPKTWQWTRIQIECLTKYVAYYEVNIRNKVDGYTEPAFEIANKRLNIGVSLFDSETGGYTNFSFVNKFKSSYELICAIMASCRAPVFTNFNATIDLQSCSGCEGASTDISAWDGCIAFVPNELKNVGFDFDNKRHITVSCNGVWVDMSVANTLGNQPHVADIWTQQSSESVDVFVELGERDMALYFRDMYNPIYSQWLIEKKSKQDGSVNEMMGMVNVDRFVWLDELIKLVFGSCDGTDVCSIYDNWIIELSKGG